MTTTTTTIKVWSETRKLLRLISAMTGETILEVAHRLASAEWKRLQAHDPSTQDSTQSDT